MWFISCRLVLRFLFHRKFVWACVNLWPICDFTMASYADGEDDQYPNGYGEFGSAPKYQHFEAEADGGGGGAEERPKILLMGLRRSGKSSIQKVVFHKMSPNETLFLEATNKIQKDDVSNSSFVQFSIWDFPGQVRLNLAWPGNLNNLHFRWISLTQLLTRT